MDDNSRLQNQQHAFAAHIRNPAQSPPPPGVEDRRMRIYRELFFNNLNSFLRDSLPVLHAVMRPDAWRSLVRDFFVCHAAQSPFFRDIPREFLCYLEEQRGERADDPPFLRELAHYEWVELALSVHEDPVPPPGLDPTGDLATGRPLLSPLAWPLRY
ncbi:MAG: putative DNA-binding domain-containing protein, partial [Thiohalobacteraceae bacterium]